MGEYFIPNIKQFFRHFRIPIILLLVVTAGFFFVTKTQQKETVGFVPSQNTERVYGDRRVFDYGDQLTDEQEADLEARIKLAEEETALDIVIVTLDESLRNYAPEYRANYSVHITPDKYVMVYADKFWEDNKFGYNCPQKLDGRTDTGDGVILVDNIYREPETNRIYTWLGTTGKALENYSDYRIESELDAFYDKLDAGYYEACVSFVNAVRIDNTPIDLDFSGAIWPFIVTGIFFTIYVVTKSRGTIGKDTTTAMTYLISDRLSFPLNDDTFLRKTVTKRYDPPSSSSGGGGGHRSGGGGSHGGGGRSR